MPYFKITHTVVNILLMGWHHLVIPIYEVSQLNQLMAAYQKDVFIVFLNY